MFGAALSGELPCAFPVGEGEGRIARVCGEVSQKVMNAPVDAFRFQAGYEAWKRLNRAAGGGEFVAGKVFIVLGQGFGGKQSVEERVVVIGRGQGKKETTVVGVAGFGEFLGWQCGLRSLRVRGFKHSVAFEKGLSRVGVARTVAYAQRN